MQIQLIASQKILLSLLGLLCLLYDGASASPAGPRENQRKRRHQTRKSADVGAATPSAMPSGAIRSAVNARPSVSWSPDTKVPARAEAALKSTVVSVSFKDALLKHKSEVERQRRESEWENTEYNALQQDLHQAIDPINTSGSGKNDVMPTVYSPSFFELRDKLWRSYHLAESTSSSPVAHVGSPWDMHDVGSDFRESILRQKTAPAELEGVDRNSDFQQQQQQDVASPLHQLSKSVPKNMHYNLVDQYSAVKHVQPEQQVPPKIRSTLNPFAKAFKVARMATEPIVQPSPVSNSGSSPRSSVSGEFQPASLKGSAFSQYANVPFDGQNLPDLQEYSGDITATLPLTSALGDLSFEETTVPIPESENENESNDIVNILREMNTNPSFSVPSLLKISKQLRSVPEAAKSLPNARKNILILDMDEVLVHTNREQLRNIDDDEQIFKMDMNQADAENLSSTTVLIGNQEYSTQLRPGLREFLRWANQYFTVGLWTAGRPDYANQVLDFIDPDKTLISEDLRYFRMHCEGIVMNTCFVKNLELYGYDLRRIFMIDDSSFSFLRQTAKVEGRRFYTNGILVEPFEGWSTASEQQSAIQQLEDLKPFLLKLAFASDVRPLIVQRQFEQMISI